MAGVVREAAARSEHLVEALLLLARTEGAELPARERVDLDEVVARALGAVDAEVRRRELRVSRVEGSAVAVGDPALLERIAGNLVENAVRHNVDGGWIRVGTEESEHGAVLRVTSSGPVVEAEGVEGLFEPFRRSGVQRTARTGAGLGLSIVRAAVIAHRGRVWAEPVAGGGLAVTVHLPAS